MKTKESKRKLPIGETGTKAKADFQGYPLYPSKEDIYNQFREEQELNPEDLSLKKATDYRDPAGIANEIDFRDDFFGDELDISGSESDVRQDNPGMKDEENSYYSIGGDEHNDLEEDRQDPIQA